MNQSDMNAFLLLLITILVSPQISRAEDSEDNILPNTVVHIDCQYQLVNDILTDISSQSSVEINYDQELEEEPLIAFNDKIEAIDAVIRVLRGKSKVIEFLDDRNTIDIKIFDDSRSLNITESEKEI